MTRTLTEDSCESEVTEFDGSVSRDENVFGLDVPMNAVVNMTELDGPKRLVDDALRLGLGNSVLAGSNE